MKHVKRISTLHSTALAVVCLSMILLTSCSKRNYVSQPDTASLTPGEAPLKSIVVLYENDVHCAIDGYAKIAGLRDAISDTAYACVVSSGDFLQGGTAGALSRGQNIADIISSVGYDAIGLGNHEFDFSGPRLMELMPQFHAPVVCANLFDASNGKQVCPSYVIKQCGPRKVAFVGVLTPETMTMESYAFYDDHDRLLYDLRVNDVYRLVQQAVDQARAAGADYVVVLSHIGEQSSDMNIDSHKMVAATHGIDVVLDGHAHSTIPSETVLNSKRQPVIVTQTGTQFANIGKLLINRDGQCSTTLLPMKECTLQSPRVTATIDSVKQLIQQTSERVVAHATAPLRINDENGVRKVRSAETNSGDIVTDAYRYVMDAEIGLSNGGGIRSERLTTEITYGDLINMLPFENYVWKVEAKGSKIIELLQKNTATLPGEDGEFPQVSGLKYTVHLSNHAVTDVQVLGKDGRYEPIDPDRIYTVATIDYCIHSNGLRGVLKGSKALKRTSVLYRDVLLEYIEKALGGKIGPEYAKPQGRITIVK